ncbi:MAG: cyanophycinase [Acetobacteraceae bacterium]|nr:cyanophycinase [Acetobacteraceae bacterium]
MGPLFLLGGVRQETFGDISREFLAACGRAPRIALLTQGGNAWRQYAAMFEGVWASLGVGEVVPVAPETPTEAARPETLRLLDEVDGIFISGGDTREYHRKYAQPGVAAVIRRASSAGTPVAGCSAGALILPARCTVWGGRASSGRGRSLLTCEHTVDQDGDGDVELLLAAGIGVVDGLVTEVECTEWGRLPRLFEAMARHRCPLGVGIDEGACLRLVEGRRAKVLGAGTVFVVLRCDEGQGFRVRPLLSGEEVDLPLPAAPGR